MGDRKPNFKRFGLSTTFPCYRKLFRKVSNRPDQELGMRGYSFLCYMTLSGGSEKRSRSHNSIFRRDLFHQFSIFAFYAIGDPKLTFHGAQDKIRESSVSLLKNSRILLSQSQCLMSDKSHFVPQMPKDSRIQSSIRPRRLSRPQGRSSSFHLGEGIRKPGIY